MAVKFPTLDEITKKMVEELAGAGKTIKDLANQWLTKAIIIAVRNIVYDQVTAAKAVYESRSIFKAVDDDLDALCEERSSTVRRKLATYAKVRFRLKKTLPATSDRTIPEGSLITSQAVGDTPALDFLIIKDNDADPLFLSGATSLIVTAECSVAGEIGNLTTGSVVYPAMTGIDSVEVVELMEEGTDREDNETLRARLIEEVQNPEKGGTYKDYEIWAKRVTGVVSARSIPLARGNGTIDVIIIGSIGLPTQILIDETQAYIDEKTPGGGASVVVKAPTPIYVNVTVSVKMKEGYSFATALPLINVALDATIQKENDVLLVRISELRNAVKNVAGVFNYTLNGEDIPLANGELALPGTYTITEVV